MGTSAYVLGLLWQLRAVDEANFNVEEMFQGWIKHLRDVDGVCGSACDHREAAYRAWLPFWLNRSAAKSLALLFLSISEPWTPAYLRLGARGTGPLRD